MVPAGLICDAVTGTTGCELGSTDNDYLKPLQVNLDSMGVRTECIMEGRIREEKVMINISLLFGVFLLVVCSTLGSGRYKWANRRRSAPDYRLPPPISRFDRYVTMVLKGHQMHAEKLLTEDERAGLSLFPDRERTHCLRSHNGSQFTNGGFNNIGTGQFTGELLDFGRVYGLRSALMDEFNCLGRYSDARSE